MSSQSTKELRGKTCKPCEGGVEKMSAAEAREQIRELEGWKLNDEATWIEKKWKLKDFQAALDFVNRAGELAESEQHHPDLHIEGYRNVRVALSTHAIGGLSENDFIMAAKIDAL
jgi:4a-hydroxytetrahydrobiopterin dehydratase